MQFTLAPLMKSGKRVRHAGEALRQCKTAMAWVSSGGGEAGLLEEDAVWR